MSRVCADELHLHRHGTSALVELAGEPRSAVWLELGPAGRTLTDREVLDRYHARVLAFVEGAAAHVVWDDARAAWRPSGRVIRCVVEAGPTLEEPVVAILGDSELELGLGDLGRMLEVHGAHICIVFLDS